MKMTTAAKAASLGYPYVDPHHPRSTSDNMVWLTHFCKTVDHSDPGIYVGWNQPFHCWVIEKPKIGAN